MSHRNYMKSAIAMAILAATSAAFAQDAMRGVVYHDSNSDYSGTFWGQKSKMDFSRTTSRSSAEWCATLRSIMHAITSTSISSRIVHGLSVACDRLEIPYWTGRHHGDIKMKMEAL